MYRCYIDIESTGFDPIRNDVVSLACIITDDEFNKLDEFYETVRPEFNKFYSEDAEKVHGFSREKLMTFQHPEKFCINFLKFLKPYKCENNCPRIFVNHSLRQFDYLFTEWLFRKAGMHFSFWRFFSQDFQRSTITVARKHGYNPNKLNVWAERLNFDLDHHNALSDTQCCLEIDKYLVNNYEKFHRGK